jgi:hypothetical protein
LSALDLAGEDGFFPNVHVEKKQRIGQENSDAVQSSERSIGAIEGILKIVRQLNRRSWR